MTPEGKVKARVKLLLKKFKPHVWYFMPVSMGAGQRGIPDFIICANSTFVAVECKSDDGKLTPLQQMQLSNIYSAGGYTMTVAESYGLDVLESHLNMILSR